VVEVGGAKGLKLSKDGEIIIKTGLGDLKLSKPVAWQEKDGKKLPVEVSYKLIGKNRYSFEVAKADPSLPIVIDPILQSTYVGGSGRDYAYALAIHPTTGDVYVAGSTDSTNFPRTSGGAQAINADNGYQWDAFVTRLNSGLTQILQSTYLGGSGRDYANALAISSTGDVYVAGSTNSTNFPNTSGGAQASNRGSYDAFVARLNKELTQILQATYLGGGNYDYAYAFAIHPTTGDVYVAGYTFSSDFPRTTGGAQASKGGWDDAFVARLNSSLTQILQSTYLGGRGDDYANALAISPTGDVYVAGYTDSTDFPGTFGGAQPTLRDLSTDAFIARLNSSLTQILQSTYLGGSGSDKAYALAIHPTTGEVYVAGETWSTNFPGTSGGAQTINADNGTRREAFVSKLNSSLTQILQSTYLGGRGGDYANALAISSTGDVYVAGYTDSTDFPGTFGGAQPTLRDLSTDAFIARLNSSLTQILQSTYLGGSGSDKAYALAIHPTTGEVYVAGETWSTNFPGTTGGAQTGRGGLSDAFVARLTADLAAGSGSGGGSGGTGGGGGGFVAVGGTGGGGGGGGCSMTGSASSMAGLWNILVWLSIPVFALARRIRRK
jgi:hypothetical protein